MQHFSHKLIKNICPLVGGGVYLIMQLHAKWIRSMSNKVRCLKCRGQKEYAGMGGIMKDCEVCNGTGKVEPVKLEIVENKKEIEHVEPVKEELKVETVSAAEAFASMGVPAEVVKEAMANPPLIVSQGEILPLNAPVIDEFMQAVLDEPRMDPISWQAKYKHVSRLFGVDITGHFGELVTKVERAAIRANYASTQVIAERTVDLSVSQDSVSNSDPEYAAFTAQEKKLKAEAEKKAVKK